VEAVIRDPLGEGRVGPAAVAGEEEDEDRGGPGSDRFIERGRSRPSTKRGMRMSGPSGSGRANGLGPPTNPATASNDTVIGAS
jgi:hypothetical protein